MTNGWILGAAAALLAAGCGGRLQVVDVRSTPPGATVYRIEGLPPGAPADAAGTVTVTAASGPAIGRTPLVYRPESSGPFRLRLVLEGHEPCEFAVPPGAVEARLAVALEPSAGRADEEAILEALLAGGPLGRSELVEVVAPRVPAKRAKEAIERLAGEAELLEEVGAKRDAYDLGLRGLTRLRERLGEGAVLEQLLASRREVHLRARERRR